MNVKDINCGALRDSKELKWSKHREMITLRYIHVLKYISHSKYFSSNVF